VGGVNIASTTLKSGDVYASIRPEDILVSTKQIVSSARNSLQGRIEGIVDKGTVVRILVSVGDTPFVVIVTKQSFDDMELRKNMSVYITFKASIVHIF
jgi:ABC-type spermidine/putrescine transport systems, ATPase components